MLNQPIYVKKWSWKNKGAPIELVTRSEVDLLLNFIFFYANQNVNIRKKKYFLGTNWKNTVLEKMHFMKVNVWHQQNVTNFLASVLLYCNTYLSYKNSKTSHVRTYSVQNKHDIKQNQKLGSPVNKSVHRTETTVQSPASRVQCPTSSL